MSAAGVTMRADVRDTHPAWLDAIATTTLGPHVYDYLTSKQANQRLNGKSPDNYRYVLVKMALRLDGLEPGAVTAEHLEHVQASFPVKSMGFANAVLRSFWKWMRQRRHVPENPMDLLETPRKSRALNMEVFTDPEVEALHAQPELRDAALIALLFDTGLRADEFCSLQLLHINPVTRRLTVVRGKGDKGRVIVVGKAAAGKVNDLARLDGLRPSDFLLYKRKGGSGRTVRDAITRDEKAATDRFRRWFRRCCDTVGVDYKHPHTVRHSMASIWLRKNGNVAILSKRMGHESISTTVDIYGHFMVADQEAEVDRLSGIEVVV